MNRSSASLARTVVVGVASAGLAVVASSSVWAVREGPTRAVTQSVTQPVTQPEELAGSDLVPVVVPLTLVALACWGAVLVLRRRARRAVAVVGAAAALTASVVTVVRAVRAARSDDLDLTAWPWVVAAGAALTALALAHAWRAAPRWPEMSSRYDRRSDAQAQDARPEERTPAPVDLWRALDEGRDPTA